MRTMLSPGDKRLPDLPAALCEFVRIGRVHVGMQRVRFGFLEQALNRYPALSQLTGYILC